MPICVFQEQQFFWRQIKPCHGLRIPNTQPETKRGLWAEYQWDNGLSQGVGINDHHDMVFPRTSVLSQLVLQGNVECAFYFIICCLAGKGAFGDVLTINRIVPQTKINKGITRAFEVQL